MAQVLHPQSDMHSSPLLNGGGWSTFDYSMIHPDHGLSFEEKDPFSASLSQAEQLLATLDYSSDSDEMDAEMQDQFSSFDYSVQDTTGYESSSSNSSLETVTPYTNMSRNNSSTKIDGKAGFPFPKLSPLVQLERVSSCYFTPPSKEYIKAQQVVPAPLDISLESRFNSNYFDPCHSSAMAASASSSMIRSYSAPTHTQLEHELLKQKWNAESSQSSQITKRAASASMLTRSSSKKSHRRKSGSGASASDDSLAQCAAYPSASVPYSSRVHLLSPSKKSNPFKRSRLSYVTEESSLSRSPDQRSPSSPKHNPKTITPPKSPARPGLNRFFTSPEFFVGSGNNSTENSDDESDAEQFNPMAALPSSPSPFTAPLAIV